MAKKAPAKPPAKRKPRPKKPVDPAIIDAIRQHIAEDPLDPPKTKPVAWRSWLISAAKIVALIGLGVGGGIWSAGGIEIGPERQQKNDAVSAVFDAQETAFRKHSGELAAALRRGEVASEKAGEIWFDARFGPDVEAAWTPLLEEHFAAYGGEKWTPEKQAATVERYAQ